MPDSPLDRLPPARRAELRAYFGPDAERAAAALESLALDLPPVRIADTLTAPADRSAARTPSED